MSLGEYLNQRKSRQKQLEDKLSSIDSPTQKQQLLEKHKQRETSILRRRRKKTKLDDFQIIDMIGKGGFGKTSIEAIESR